MIDNPSLPPTAIPLPDIQAARQRLQGQVLRTPLVRLNLAEAPAQIYLKLENLQPVGSFKLRGAGNALAVAQASQLAEGVWTASAGNMALGLAWFARQGGVPCTVLAPEDAPAAKLEGVARLGARIVKTSFEEYQRIQRFGDPQRQQELGLSGLLVHPFNDPAVMAGNGCIALEILEDLPEVDAILVPYGGGGLSCGIASAVRALRPGVKVFASEAANAAPLAACLAAGRLVTVPYQASFISGMGAPFVFESMWPRASQLLNGSLVVSLQEVADALRLLAVRNHVIAEGAGAVALAAALTLKNGPLAGLAGGKIACIVSGGNIDAHLLTEILQDRLPT
ncbi:MAG: pyridoxal-phosphate dependent enzyme [Chloroflexota bacterium]